MEVWQVLLTTEPSCQPHLFVKMLRTVFKDSFRKFWDELSVMVYANNPDAFKDEAC